MSRPPTLRRDFVCVDAVVMAVGIGAAAAIMVVSALLDVIL